MRRREVCLMLCALGAGKSLAGCAGSREEMHAAALTPAASAVSQRVQQSRRFDTRDEGLLLRAVVGVLQDLGFVIEETRAEAGLVMASKDRDAVEAGQVAAQMLLVMLAAAARTQHRVVMDRNQRIRVLVVVRPTTDRASVTARATFQRVVINTDNQVSRTETLDDERLYQAFFDQLAQSAFLTAHGV